MKDEQRMTPAAEAGSISEAERTWLQRRAFEEGARFERSRALGENVTQAARRRFPIMVTRPRVITVPSVECGPREVKYIDGEFWIKDRRYPDWVRQHAVITADVVRKLYDLMHNPTEEVAE